MKFIKLVIPGQFEDAFLYMGNVIALTTHRSLRLYHLERLLQQAEPKDAPFFPIVTYLFLRNDWLSSEQFELLSKNPTIKNALAEVIYHCPDTFELPSKACSDALEGEHDLPVPGEVILHLEVYNERLYIAASSGFYHIDANWEHLGNFDSVAAVKRHDARSMFVNARFGSVNVSCGEDGLFSAFDEFGWAVHDSLQALRQTAERSIRSVWSFHDLVNYASPTSPLLLKSVRERITSRGLEERTIVTDLGKDKLDLSSLLREVLDETHGSQEEIEFVFNSNNILYAYTTNGRLLIIGMKREDPRKAGIRFSRTYTLQQIEILEMQVSQSGLVVESPDRVALFHEGQLLPIIGGEVLTVRTFPRSKRYRNIILITTEEGLTLVSPADVR